MKIYHVRVREVAELK